MPLRLAKFIGMRQCVRASDQPLLEIAIEFAGEIVCFTIRRRALFELLPGRCGFNEHSIIEVPMKPGLDGCSFNFGF